MKLTRIADDKWMLELPPDTDPATMRRYSTAWTEWWLDHTEAPLALMLEPLEYLDRREPDIESRLRRIEQHVGLDTTNLEPPVQS